MIVVQDGGLKWRWEFLGAWCGCWGEWHKVLELDVMLMEVLVLIISVVLELSDGITGWCGVSSGFCRC